MTAKKLNCHHAHWSLYLAHFNFKLIHCPGRCIRKPDRLSWRPDHGNGVSDNEDMVLLWLELLAIWDLKGVQLDRPERDILREIRQGNWEGNQEEPVTKAARELQQAPSKTVHSMEWSEDEGLLWFRGKIYVLQNTDLQRQVVSLYYDMKVAGHPGQLKTLELVSRDY